VSGEGMAGRRPFRLRLPATSANVGPGFDAVAVAFDFYLDVEAEAAPEFSIRATGCDAERCASLDDNLVIEVYKSVLAENGRPLVPLAIRMANAIPLGMGCGSSAAGRLAAITMAVHFGQLEWDNERIIEEATRLEGHPDNVAACWAGGFVAAACEGSAVRYARVEPPAEWRAIVVLPAEPLATSKARAMLPASYSMADTVKNIQSSSLLGLAFAQGRADLLSVAMRDRVHQPYRAPVCPLLPLVLALVGRHGIAGAALSGAGPAVLAIVEGEEKVAEACAAMQEAVSGHQQIELRVCRMVANGASAQFPEIG